MALTDRFAAGRENDAGNPAPSDGAALAYATSGDMHRRVKPKHVPAFAVVAAICVAISGGCKPDHGRHGRPGESVASCESGRRRQGETKDPALSGWATNAEAPAKKDKTASKPDSKTGPAKLQHGETRTLTLPGGAKMEMIYVAPGGFTMGSPESEEGRYNDETQHHVTLTKGFWLGKYEVTQAQWKSVIGSNPSEFKGDDRPVEKVSWDDCQEFIRKANSEAEHQFGGDARLPTEAEWEYACRAGSYGAFAGTGCPDSMVWYDKNSGDKTHSAGRKHPNAWGFFDMHGNVREWCSDWYGTYSGGSVTDPAGAVSGDSRVLRGGSLFDIERDCRSAKRDKDASGSRSWRNGFRLACSAGLCGREPASPASAGTQPPKEENASVSAAAEGTDELRSGMTKTLTLPGGATMEMVYVAPGSFTMGSPKSEAGRCNDETQHIVTLTKGFWLGKYEVTQKQWKSVMGSNPSKFKGDDWPVENVSWKDCQEFISKVNSEAKFQFCGPACLPMEAEWEYACRAGGTNAYHWGNALNGDKANCKGVDPCGTTVKGQFLKRTCPVGGYAPNAWGFHDMHGNVWEWCGDWYAEYSGDSETDPVGGEPGECHVLRGGSWSRDAPSCRSACRHKLGPSFRSEELGFRLACLKKAVKPHPNPPKPSTEPRHGDTKTLTLPGGTKMEMIYVAPGSFRMGSPRLENGRFDNETQHRVTLTNGFWLGKYEVTQAQWESVMGSNPSEFKGYDRPVEKVSWEDSQEFIRKVNAEAKRQFGCEARLPTEAEWEYACRAGTSGAFAGNLDTMGWYGSGAGTSPVGKKKPNRWGFYDMHGNVWEWCGDWYAEYSGGSETNPAGAASGTDRVLRGGSWFSYEARFCRSACRMHGSPGDPTDATGFRLACSQKRPEAGKPPDSQNGPAKPRPPLPPPPSKPHHRETRTLTLPGGAKMEMIYVAPGSFTMGSPRSEKGRAKYIDETQHRVTLTKGYWLGKYEVTQAQWTSVMGSNPSAFKGNGNLPVESVSWNDCQEFIRKVNAEAKRQFGGEARLPTEAEWEYACRAESAGAYAGTGNINTMGWYRGNSGKKTHPAGRMRSNAWGFYDMHGSVWEWCSDWYGVYAGGSVTDPAGPASGKYRILRGGCWLADARGCRSATRLGLSPDKHYWDDGFRLACSAEPGGQGAEQ